MTKSTRDQVFLSYASEDIDKASEVYKGLTKRGLKVWFDKEDLGPGRWKDKVLREIPRSRYFVILISEAALRKTGKKPGFQDNELNRAYNIAETMKDEEFTIVPVRIENCHRGDLRLCGFQQYDLFNDIDKGLDKLAIHLGGKSLSDPKAKDQRTKDEVTIAHLMNMADFEFYADEYEKALTIWNIVLLKEPDQPNAWHNKGFALCELGRYEESIIAFEKALEIRPNSFVTWTYKGIALYLLGRHKEALDACENALKIEPIFPKALNFKKEIFSGNFQVGNYL